jgi:hypothetical protein
MRWPVYNRKVRNLTFMIMYLIASMVIVFMINYERPEEKAIREYFNLPKNPAWPIYLIYAMLAAGLCVVYIFLFKIEERRRRYVAASFGAAGFLWLALFHHFWWGGFIGVAVMLAIVLIGWLYPARNTDRGQV